MTEPAPTEVVWPSSAVIDDGSLVLVDGARSRVSLCRCAGGVAVVKRFRGATANRHRDAASRRFAAERRAAWALADASPFVLRPLATVVDAPVMAVVLPFCGRFRSLDVLLHGGATHDWSPAGDRGCVTPSRAWRALLAFDAARGVAAAHASGVVLRDVKPANVLVGDDGVGRLADFELSFFAGDPAAEAAGGGGPASKPRRIFEGTPQYVAPEQIRAYDGVVLHGALADPMRSASTAAADVYALAVSANEAGTRAAKESEIPNFKGSYLGRFPLAGTTVVPFTDVTRTDAQLQTVVEVKYSTTALCRAVASEGLRPALVDASFGGLEFCDLVRESWADAPAARPRAAAFAERLAACFAGDAIFERGVSVKGRGALAADADEPLWTCDAAAAEPPAVEEALGPLTDAERDAVDAMGRRRRRRPPRRGWAWEAHRGPRDAMEDAAGGLDYGPHAGCYVVSDGHGGAAVARLAVDSLPTLVARSLAATTGGDGDVRAALVDAFHACEARCGALAGGACVVLALLLGDDLFVAHVGDCRAVLDRDGDEGWTWSRAHGPAPDALAGPFAGGVARLTEDHAPAGREAARVAKAGGRLLETRDGKVRVGRTRGPGGLAVSRALGDAGEYCGVVASPAVWNSTAARSIRSRFG
ncbi:hypothetical protein AURANDRAFT_64030 [Aureococcus anophagefferens]|uniref:Protein kinase domain-containing protein n=1 Tax=Aureococcus anophagefferens TaxID=44056 RepID=F0Y8M6_AURAN|nr:hypothetical protein AURANDRAFT_64030 [Aureococcus anophagefferens]EGB08635.1 hypothetical protein AURANDRAFT_64030 [Aureococcus anophagefferens]|eukprot:XP_009036630.1 hypothetical protein AURANDRAFT_64030 [Aureococcus anophagefferens]